MLDKRDIKAVEARGITVDQVESQLQRFEKGFKPTKVLSPAVIGDGILALSEEERSAFLKKYENADVNVCKFIPASGAASRMFKQLYAFLDQYDESDQAYESFKTERGPVFQFIESIQQFAFYEELDKTLRKVSGIGLSEAILKRKYKAVVDCLLSEKGLGYGSLPKGLLSFHKNGSRSKTPAQEHITEGLQYALKKGRLHLHFTVSPDHLTRFEQHVKEEVKLHEATIEAVFSTQQPNTDTVAATMSNQVFRNEDGALLFRPAGHGALLSNLNEISQEVIYLKNIDNVAPERLQADTIEWKKVLAGVLLSYQERTFALLEKLENGEHVNEEARSLLEEMGCRLVEDTAFDISAKLDRPIRVCGMVRNEGQPGGGPFWVRDMQGDESLQIVESAQIDLGDSAQEEVVNQSTHFNPVDVVCGVYDHKGEKFDLMKFRDPETGFITEKTYNGEKLKAMELPGLWNGSMANWNTIFVEVPISTFSPVKTVNDLLKEEHQ
ncbi:MAG: DUF4301 family protein [Bacteroidota bacterium]